jgi:hypothetical protein
MISHLLSYNAGTYSIRTKQLGWYKQPYPCILLESFQSLLLLASIVHSKQEERIIITPSHAPAATDLSLQRIVIAFKLSSSHKSMGHS